ncbi:hypothetical protein EJ08DRAFT_664683 [Tothia fuscella]|uniref:Uncharacterized protein n=1 Tax=Tothia fuscella TaxID=1048955 RepID=A0A9P4TUI7_9PEZI|nr:hypothetical protein EJ08DRAFT_664683 [Tothia fuscella]
MSTSVSFTSSSTASATLTPPSSATVTSTPPYFAPTTNVTLGLLPPTKNPAFLLYGDIALYNPTLYLTALGLFQHTAVFGLIFLLRSFNTSRALDTHFLSIIFAFSFVADPLVFLLDPHISPIKLFFFLENEAVEFLLFIRVVAPKKWCSKFAGRVCLACWFALATVTVVVSFHDKYKHGAEIVAWCAFVSDSCIAITGVVLEKRWFEARYTEKALRGWSSGMTDERLRKRKVTAERMAGMGFILHGLTTLPIAPILTRILYSSLTPSYFAYAWTLVFSAAMITVALCIPSATLFFSTINWCCWHDRKTLPGQASYSDGDNSDVENGPMTGRNIALFPMKSAGVSVRSMKSPRVDAGGRIVPLSPGNFGDDGFGNRVSISQRFYDDGSGARENGGLGRMNSGRQDLRMRPGSYVSWTRLGAGERVVEAR